MTQEIAEYLATDLGRDYRALKLNRKWLVWCGPSDHEVEFDYKDIERAAILLFCRNA
jgi:hypothetical protein